MFFETQHFKGILLHPGKNTHLLPVKSKITRSVCKIKDYSQDAINSNRIEKWLETGSLGMIIYRISTGVFVGGWLHGSWHKTSCKTLK